MTHKQLVETFVKPARHVQNARFRSALGETERSRVCNGPLRKVYARFPSFTVDGKYGNNPDTIGLVCDACFKGVVFQELVESAIRADAPPPPAPP